MPAVERKLAPILAADVAGYSRLMGADEEGTLERLKALRQELVDPKSGEHHGRIVRTRCVSWSRRRRKDWRQRLVRSPSCPRSSI